MLLEAPFLGWCCKPSTPTAEGCSTGSPSTVFCSAHIFLPCCGLNAGISGSVCVFVCVFAPCNGEHFDLCEHKTQPLLLPLRWLREGCAVTHLFENTTSKQAWRVPGANKPLQILQGPGLASQRCASLLVVLNTALSSSERRTSDAIRCRQQHLGRAKKPGSA